MEKDDESERRRAERIPINSEFAAMPSATFISDLSEYGVFVETSSLAPMGSTVKLRFTVLLDDPVIVEAEGRVVRHRQDPTPGMGIEFTDLEPEMILRINDVVSRQRPRDSGPPLAAIPEAAGAAEAAEAEAEAPKPAQVFQPPPLPSQRAHALDDAKTSHYPVVPSTTADDPE